MTETPTDTADNETETVDAPQPGAIDPAEAAALIESSDVLVVDIRLDYEWDEGHIADASHIEINNLVAAADSLPNDRPVLFYCRSGRRSGMATAAFREAGYDVRHIDGGLLAWVESGLPIEPEDGQVATVRPR